MTYDNAGSKDIIQGILVELREITARVGELEKRSKPSINCDDKFWTPKEGKSITCGDRPAPKTALEKKMEKFYKGDQTGVKFE